MRLVHRAEVSYTPSGDISTDLSRLRSTSDGFLDEVHTLRNTHAADVVSLWVGGNPGGCGVGYLLTVVSTAFATSAFNVTVRSCATGNYSFGHEMGHNMGARHDWFVDSTNSSPYTYNHGYVAPNDAWRTVMAYADDCGGTCQRLLYWSNPNVNHPTDGQPMGVAEGQTRAADNRKTLNNTANTVANFRQSTAGPPPTLANDNFAAATAVGALPASFTVDTTPATTESGEPLTCSSSTMGKTVWYSFTPSATGTVAIATAGSSFDTMVAVYTGSALGSLTQVGCNDDSGSGTQSLVTFPATAGTTYRIQVGGYSSASGSLMVNVSGSSAPTFTPTPPRTATPTRTSTPTVTPTPTLGPVVCSPRPNVAVATTPVSGGRLQVTLTAQETNNRITGLSFSSTDNGSVDVSGLGGATGAFTVALSPWAQSTTFFVNRTASGQATTITLIVNDRCGSWPTLVGGGPGAF